MAEKWPSSVVFTVPQGAAEYVSAAEVMPSEERKALVVVKLKAQVAYAWARSPFYRRLWRAAGVSPDSLVTLDDLRRFPLVTKDLVRADQLAAPPFGSNLCCGEGDVAQINATSGTTGRPALFAISRDDWARIGAAHARIMWSFGVRPSDTVFIASPFGLYLGSWGALAGSKALGACTLPFGAGGQGQTTRAIQALSLVRPTVIYATPSYALHLARTARNNGVDPREFGIRIAFFSGEPGAGIRATKSRIEEMFGAACIDTGSMAEMTPWMTNAECSERRGMHLWDDIVYTEVLDLETQDAVADSGEGVLVYTHLERTSQPMIRYFSGDLAQVIDEPCPCGRTYRRLPNGIRGRVDDMLIVRGVNIHPSSIDEALRAIDGLGAEYRILVDRPRELDVLTIEVEAADVSVEQHVAERVKAATGVTPLVMVRPLDTLPTTDFKARRVVDRRMVDADSGPDS